MCSTTENENDHADQNRNCLEGIACPQCRNRHCLKIEVTTLALVTDDGAEAIGEMSWNDESSTHCPECGYQGLLKEFQITARSSTLTPNADVKTDQRALGAGLAIATFQRATGCHYEEVLGDLLADLMHWADRHNFDFEAAFIRGRDQYAGIAGAQP